MKENNKDIIKKILTSSEVPDEVSPESMKQMLEEKAHRKKRNSIRHTVLKTTAGAAACAVIAGTSVYFAGQRNNHKFDAGESSENSAAEATVPGSHNVKEENQTVSVLRSASDYGDIYRILRRADFMDKFENNFSFSEIEVYEEIAGDAVENETSADSNVNGETDRKTHQYSDTYNQEDSVLEADIAKTDGECLYLVSNSTGTDYKTVPYLTAASVDNGSFTGSSQLNIADTLALETDEDYESSVDVHDMYIYNDMLVVIGTFSQYYTGERDFRIYNDCCDCLCGGWYDCDTATFVNIYTTGTEPELLWSYTQDGYYSDVRITGDGIMYVVTNYNSASYNKIDEEESYTEYIPEFSVNGENSLIPAENIMLPPVGFKTETNIEYAVVGGLDLSEYGKAESTDIKAFSGYPSTIYCSGDNLYLAYGWDETHITRLALENGTITAAATGTVEGYIKDQFSMSEYGGYFRIAATSETYEETNEIFYDEEVVSYSRTGIDNIVYVLDLDLNEVGKVDGIGVGETIKSVNFSGNMAYVVTYEQTDPLFAIDLSNPNAPAVLDEYKLPGYSTYMQQWADGQLFGFGIYADENAREDGVKAVMFDNSDPADLGEIDSICFTSRGEDADYIWSEAAWERKALLIAPEKNIIAFPIIKYDNDLYGRTSDFVFLSFEDGRFTVRGTFSKELLDYDDNSRFVRALYIDDYVYVLSDNRFISADIATLTQVDEIDF
ncbi:MAG: beta-propeller domain-containing protein [Ruminococcus sp.]